MLLTSDLAGESHCASIITKRLGPSCDADSLSATKDLNMCDIDSKHGRAALSAMLNAIVGQNEPVVPPPADYNGEFFSGISFLNIANLVVLH